jgi:hypothetical protein
MSLAATITLVIILVAFRLLLPPVPGMVKIHFRRWGTRNTIILCTISAAGAALAIFFSRH